MKDPCPEILLVNPWIYDFAAYNLWARPLGLLYIASVLRRCGYRVRLLDCLDIQYGLPFMGKSKAASEKKKYGCGKFPKRTLPKPAVYRRIPRRYGRYGISDETFDNALAQLTAPVAALVTSGMTYWYPGAFRAIELVRAHFPEIPILMGGIYATLCCDHARRFSGADQVIAGPGEAAVLKTLSYLTGKRSDTKKFKDLTDLPFPAHDLYSQPEYACVLTSRGCPYHCSYCASDLLFGRYRRRTVESVLAELEWLRRGLQVKNIAFYDDALLVDSDAHIKPILEGIIRMDLDCWFHTPNGLHARMIDRELAGLMFLSGFKTVRLSFDTADAPAGERGGRKATALDLSRAVANLETAGYDRTEIGVYLLVGLPSQSYRKLIESLDFVADLGVQTKLAFYSPIPGTAEWSLAVQDGLQDPQADPLLHNNTVFPTTSPRLPPEKLEAIKKYVNSKNASLSPTRR